ncbi:YidB family protein (plasmid) [Shinella sumterensis]|nr:YidB family protein [Shinella sumterensis]
MGLLDGLQNIVSDALNGKPVDLMAVAGQVLQNAGGLNGIVAQLNQAGLGEQVTSWIGTGSNLPISEDQIKTALSSDTLRNLAQSFGVDVDQLPQLLAEHLPKMVDKASPNGVLPS